MKNLTKLIFGFIFFLLALTVAYSMTVTDSNKEEIKQLSQVPKTENIAYSEDLSKEFIETLNVFDISLHDINLDGVITVYNPLDSSENINELPYQIIKTAEYYYYKAAETETLNGNKGYVFIDHNAKTILLSETKSFNLGEALPNAKELIRVLKEQDFKLTSTEDNDRKTIILENNYNLNQHKFALTIDKKTKQPLNIYSKYPNLTDPLNTGLDKVVNYTINFKDSNKDRPFILSLFAGNMKVNFSNYYPLYSIIDNQ